ncbi:recombinase family protein [Hydrogenimonas urashimensis]|uniref:recombinase family protein n=1 Tax=Hydrogenimonas urashimensis TaxID=2740515 RepID=UPI0019161C90|nr:recombinase family protein [Hydrogenimonas urashimensis]
MTYAYLRQIPGTKNLTLQQKDVIGYALGQGLEIDKEVVEHSSKNRPIEERKQFEEFMHSMEEGDNLIIDEIWTLSNRVEELVKILCCTMSRKINLYVASRGILITKETPIGYVMPLLNELREESHDRRSGVGRPKGSKSRSKFDTLQPKILQMLKDGQSVSAIARELGVSRSSLKDYIESRSLKELVENTFVEIGRPLETDIISDEILICPFEQEDRNNNTIKQKGVN